MSDVPPRGRNLVQGILTFVLGCIIVTADQPHQLLRMHLMAMRAISILLRHWAMGTALNNHIFYFRRFRRDGALV
jgi:hypothetical protein